MEIPRSESFMSLPQFMSSLDGREDGEKRKRVGQICGPRFVRESVVQSRQKAQKDCAKAQCSSVSLANQSL